MDYTEATNIGAPRQVTRRIVGFCLVVFGAITLHIATKSMKISPTLQSDELLDAIGAVTPVYDLMPRGSPFRLMEHKPPNHVLCSSMKMWDEQGAGSDSWWHVIDATEDGHWFRLQETKQPNHVLCSSMKMWDASGAGSDSWWSIVDYDGDKFFRLEEWKPPHHVLCSSMKMWDYFGAGDDSWWRVEKAKAEKIIIHDVHYSIDAATQTQEAIRRALASSQAENRNQHAQVIHLTLETEAAKSRSWNVGASASITVGVETEVEAGIPFVADGKVKTKVESTTSFSAGASGVHSESVKLSGSVDVTVPPHSYTELSVMYTKYKLDVPYTATKSMYYKDQPREDVHIKGVYHGVTVGNFRIIIGNSYPLKP